LSVLRGFSAEPAGPPPKHSAADECQQNDPEDSHPNEPTNGKASDQYKDREQDDAANNEDSREFHGTRQRSVVSGSCFVLGCFVLGCFVLGALYLVLCTWWLHFEPVTSKWYFEKEDNLNYTSKYKAPSTKYKPGY
jgi:hypothetical protein